MALSVHCVRVFGKPHAYHQFNGFRCEELRATGFFLYEKVDLTNIETSICIMLGVPFETSVEEIAHFLGPYSSSIEKITVIEIANCNSEAAENIQESKTCLIYFSATEVVESFITVYENIHFPTFEDVAPCVTLRIQSPIIIESDDQTLKKSNVSRQLPHCSACIRRLKPNVTGLPTNVALPPLHANSNVLRCLVCASLGGQVSVKCHACGLRENVWICLLCGSNGCGRYSSQHAKQHYELCSHPFSVELASGRIWDYDFDTFVQQDLQQQSIIYEPTFDSQVASREYFPSSPKSSPTKFNQPCTGSISTEKLAGGSQPVFNEADRLDSGTLNKIDSLSNHYESLLQSQLEDQQIFYEKALARETARAFERTKLNSLDRPTLGLSSNLFNKSSDIPETVSLVELEEIEAYKLDISASESDFDRLARSISLLEQRVREARKQNELLMKEQKQQRDLVNDLGRQEREMKLKCSAQSEEFKQQLYEMKFYAKTKTQLSGELAEFEVDGSHLLVTESQKPQNDKKRKGGKRR